MMSEVLRALGLSISCLAAFGITAPAPSSENPMLALSENFKKEFVTRFQIESFSELSYPPSNGGLKVSQIRSVFREKMPHAKNSHIKRLALRFFELCAQHRFDPAFILAVIEIESGFNPRAISPVGARGLMQVMPGTAEYISDRYGLAYLHKDELLDPIFNLRYGILYLAELRARFSSVLPHFLAAYNAGPGTVEKLLARSEFRATQLRRYVENILRAFPSYRFISAKSDHV